MTRIQIGNVLTEANGDELTVYLHCYGNEEPDEIEVDGKACMLTFDPGTTAGRGQIRTFIQRLQEAVTAHATAVEEIYGQLKVGDDCSLIRACVDGETPCPHLAGTIGSLRLHCSRPAHEDFHHVTVDADYQVIAVRHTTDCVIQGA
jgi:hypothetical protein